MKSGCVLLIMLPVMTVYSGLAALWQAYVVHKIWVWHFASVLDPRPVTTIFAALLALWVVRNKRSNPSNQADTRSEEQKLRDMATMLIAPFLTPALALLFAWLAT